MKSCAKDKWKQAVCQELKSLIKYKTLNLVPRPTDRKIVQYGCVFAIKTDQNNRIVKYKATFVAKGFTKVLRVDYKDILSPVSRFESLRFLLAYCNDHDYEIDQYDVKTAFLNGLLCEEVFMEVPSIPEEMRKFLRTQVLESTCDILEKIQDARFSNFVLHFYKAIYGLKQVSEQ